MNESIEELLASGALVPDRPGSKRLVPAAQSVVVPVGGGYDASDVRYGLHLIANEDCDEVAASYYAKKALAHLAAPAPSSLAGGEVREAVARIIAPDLRWDRDAVVAEVSAMRAEINRSWETTVEHAAQYRFNLHLAHRAVARSKAEAILAALSPEAPAREGVVKACADFQEAIDYFEADVADALAEDSERADLWDREVTVNIDALKTVMNAALTPRHEAPAEGAGERADLITDLEALLDAEPVFVVNHPIQRAINALRARSSAPEAREGEAVGVVHGLKADLNTAELPDGTLLYTHPAAPSGDHAELTRLAEAAGEEALGNLLAVIHGDGGHRALEVGTKQAALEAEKIVAGLFAAPSADKLRIAVEALEPFANLGVTSGPDDEPCHYAYRITRGAIRNARQALATLKAEGGK